MAQILAIPLHLLTNTANFLFGIDPIEQKLQIAKLYAQTLSMRYR